VHRVGEVVEGKQPVRIPATGTDEPAPLWTAQLLRHWPWWRWEEINLADVGPDQAPVLFHRIAGHLQPRDELRFDAFDRDRGTRAAAVELETVVAARQDVAIRVAE